MKTLKPDNKDYGLIAVNYFQNTRFTESFTQKNNFRLNDFTEWVFHPGMLFHARTKWWGDQGQRDKPHEGLDLCLYKDMRKRIHNLDENTKIPMIQDGVVVRIIDDFIGQSIIIEHKPSHIDQFIFYTIYGHTFQNEKLNEGATVKKGDIIANIADPGKSNKNILPHLHVSLAYSPNVISYDQLDWKQFSSLETLTLLDPLQIMGLHSILEQIKIEQLSIS